MPAKPLDALDLPEAAAPYLADYFGAWAIEPERFGQIFGHVRELNLAAHIQQTLGSQPSAFLMSSGQDYQTTPGGVAILHARGTLMKGYSSLSAGTSTVALRRQLRQAVANPDVSAILLKVDSPGGTVAGTQDLAAEVERAAKQKPLIAFVEDLCASAAYWTAAAAGWIVANNDTALIGSIGTYSVVADYSEAAAKEGVRVHVLRSGNFKGAGTPGAEITAEQLAEFQRIVDSLNEQFLAAVAKHRTKTLPQVKALADGRVHPAREALALGLIDEINTLDAVVERLTRDGNQRRNSRRMSLEQHAAPIAATLIAANMPATLAQLRGACQGADDTFLLAQLEAQADLSTAQAAWMRKLNEQLIARTKERDELDEKAKAAPVAKIGAEPLTTRTVASGARGGAASQASATGNPVEDYNAAVREYVGRGMDRRRASLAVARNLPDLHQAFLLATNEGARKQALIAERFAA